MSASHAPSHAPSKMTELTFLPFPLACEKCFDVPPPDLSAITPWVLPSGSTASKIILSSLSETNISARSSMLMLSSYKGEEDN